MPKIESTRGISNHIQEVISQSEHSIILITPYLKIEESLYKRLQLADRRGIEILIIYGKTKLAYKQQKMLEELDNCRLLFLENLHAKIYMNESFGILGSMNLYDFSEINNTELGISFSRKEDFQLFIQAQNEVDLIIDSAKLVKDTKGVEDEKEEEQIIKKLIIASKQSDSDFSVKDYPIKDIEISVQYGFATYILDKKVSQLKTVREQTCQYFFDALSKEYRVYWEEPYNKISIYKDKKVSFGSRSIEDRYKATAIKKANQLIKEYLK